jgi:hypothetical protein
VTKALECAAPNSSSIGSAPWSHASARVVPLKRDARQSASKEMSGFPSGLWWVGDQVKKEVLSVLNGAPMLQGIGN